MPITHEWNGTILTITSDSGSSSCDLKGEKGDDGARGPQGAACVIAADTQKLDGKEAKYYLQPYNLLDNSYFIEPVNQRNIYTATAWNYMLDRWLAYHYDASIQLNENGITLFNDTYLVQRVPIEKIKVGKWYSIAIYYANGEVDVGGSYINTEHLEQTCDIVYSKNNGCVLSQRSNGKFLDFGIIKEDKEIMACALYEGEYTAENIPPYVPKGYAVELAECQRYYYAPRNSQFAIPVSLGGYTVLQFPVKMRYTPTITIEELNAVSVVIVEQGEWGGAVRNDNAATSQFRYIASADL